MAKPSKTEKASQPRRRAACLLCAVGLTLCLHTGCQSSGGGAAATAPQDPLFGERALEKPSSIGPPPPPQNRAGMTTPSPPATTASKSAAAMLIPDPPPGGKQLAITSQTPGGQPSATWQPQDRPAGGGPGVILNAPQPAQTPIQPVPPPTTPPGFGPGPVTLAPVPVVNQAMVNQPAVNQAAFSQPDDLQKALDARGVFRCDQQTVPDGVRVRCRVANPQNRDSVRVYEATARDYQTAVQAVLEQIDQKR